MEKTDNFKIIRLAESHQASPRSPIPLYSTTPNPSLFRYDPTLNIAIEEKNPDKICQYPACPRRETKYAGRKMKVCARCKHVRYCSKECQKQDWAWHKMRGCKDFQSATIMRDGWSNTKLSLLGPPQKLSRSTQPTTHKIVRILVTYADRIPPAVGPIPSPFYILNSHVVSLNHNAITTRLATPEERAESQAIRENGGAGRAILAFYFVDDPLDPKSTSIMKPLKIDLTDPLVPGYRHFDGWKSVLAGVVNGTISALDFDQNFGYQSSNANVEEVHEEVYADGKPEERAAFLD